MEGTKYSQKSSVTQKDKTKFRATSRWKNFRASMYKKSGGLDEITGKPLRKGHWNLHHLDLDSNNYEVLKDDRFMCLNNQTHDFIHWAYRYYRNDGKAFINNFEKALERMKELEVR